MQDDVQDESTGTLMHLQPYKDCVMITVLTRDMKPLSQASATWKQLEELRDRAEQYAPFMVTNTPLTPYSPKVH